VAGDGHRPERFALRPFAPPPPPLVRHAPPAGRGLLAVRVLRPPVRVLVELAAGVGGAPRPARLAPADAAAPDDQPMRRSQLSGVVTVASGPWDLEEAWWGDHAVEREYWDVELGDGGVFRLYRDRRGGQWFVDGVYD
jgi:protein ImuB